MRLDLVGQKAAHVVAEQIELFIAGRHRLHPPVQYRMQRLSR
jgi:hypothetical protein